MRISMPVDRFLAIASCIAYTVLDNFLRPHLNSVLFEVQDGTLSVVSTDGHRMSVWTEAVSASDASDGKLLMSKDALEAAMRSCKPHAKSSATVTLDDDGEQMRVALFVSGVLMASLGLAKQDARIFTSWRQVMPAEGRKSDVSWNVNPEYMVDACAAHVKAGKFHGIYSPKKPRGVRFETSGELDPILVVMDGSPLKVVIMPLRNPTK